MQFIHKYKNKMNKNFRQQSSYLHRYLRWFLCFIGLALVVHGYADTDLLSGTPGDLTATFFGSGKIYLYLAEIVSATVTYIKTHNLMYFLGIVVVSFIINIIAHKFVGGSVV